MYGSGTSLEDLTKVALNQAFEFNPPSTNDTTNNNNNINHNVRRFFLNCVESVLFSKITFTKPNANPAFFFFFRCFVFVPVADVAFVWSLFREIYVCQAIGQRTRRFNGHWVTFPNDVVKQKHFKVDFSAFFLLLTVAIVMHSSSKALNTSGTFRATPWALSSQNKLLSSAEVLG